MLFLALGLAALLATQAPVGGVAGRVLEADTGRPVPGARVTLVPEARPPSAPFTPLMAETDADGVYRFAGLAPGRYRLNVQAAGFAVPGFPPAPPPAVQVLAGQTQAAPDYRLERGGAIAGRLLDPNGQPLVEARVMALRRSPVGRGSTPALLPVGNGGQTNDLGEFRLYSLPAGEYYVQMIPRTDPGFGGVAASTSATAAAATYYPGTPDVASARAIVVSAGQTVQDIEFSAVVVPVFDVSGLVVDESGAPIVEAMVTLAADRSSGAQSFGPPPRARSDAQGRFRVTRVANGTYVVNAAVPTTINPGAGPSTGGLTWSTGMSVVGGPSGGGGSTMTESRNGTTVQYRSDNATAARVTVQDGDVTDVRLTVRRQQ